MTGNAQNWTTCDATFSNSSVHYTFKILRHPTITAGDFGIIEDSTGTKNWPRIVKIMKIHENPNINVNVGFKYKWIVSTIKQDGIKLIAQQLEKDYPT